MRIARIYRSGEVICKDGPVARTVAKTLGLGAAYLLLASLAAPVLAQNQRTGVSLPEPVTSTSADDGNTPEPAPAVPAQSSVPAKPSAAVPMAVAGTPDAGTIVPASPETVYGPYVPYRAPGTPEPAASPAAVGATAFDPDANIVTEATAGQDERNLLNGPGGSAGKADPGARIVTRVASRPGEILDGTLVKARLREQLSTLTTRPGTRFTAEVSEPVMNDGRVVIPEGAVLEGLVTWVRGGKRIGGSAAIHLEPRAVTMPDGSMYVLRARAIDTNSWQNTKVDSEGTITRGESGKRDAGVFALTAGGGAAAGAMIAGVPGALIGAGVGAGVSAVVWLKQDRQAVLPKDLGIVFSLTEPMMVTPNVGVAPMATRGAGGE